MKKTFLFLTLIVVAAFTFTGCKEDDDAVESYLMAGEDKYIIVGGDVFFEGADPMNVNTHQYSISLVTGGLTYTSWDGYNPSYSGNGVLALFHLRTTGATQLADGDYSLTLTEGNWCSGGGYEIDFSSAWNNVSEFETGILTLSISGDTYTIDFQGEDEYGIAVEIFFTGKLTYHDESDYFGD